MTVQVTTGKVKATAMPLENKPKAAAAQKVSVPTNKQATESRPRRVQPDQK